jgi:hypothetical protein
MRIIIGCSKLLMAPFLLLLICSFPFHALSSHGLVLPDDSLGPSPSFMVIASFAFGEVHKIDQ